MAGYTRTDTTNNIADGNIINATDLDNEFDGIQAAFNSSTGHNHDGTTGEGAPILVLGPTQDVVVGATTVTPKTTNTVDIGSSSLKFKDLFLAGNASIGGTLAVTGVATLTAQPILSSLTASRAVFTDGSKGLVSNAITGTGNVVMSASPTLTGTIGGENATLSGTLGVTGVATFTAQPIVSSLTASRAVFSDGSKGLVSNAITGTGNVVMSASPTLTGTISAEALTTSSTVTHNGGTANGVAYLNGSKVLTTGSALTFDGTNFVNGAGGVRAGTNSGGGGVLSAWGGASGATIDITPSTSSGANGVTYNTSFISGGSGPHIFSIGGSEQMRLTSTGLGIGTSSPSYKLHIQSATPVFTIQDTTSAAGGVGGTINFISYTSGTSGANIEAQIKGVKSSANAAGELQLFTSDSTGTSTQRAIIDGSGNLGLGVTPSAGGSIYYKSFELGKAGCGLFAATASLTGSELTYLAGNAVLTYSAGPLWLYGNNGNAATYGIEDGNHKWFTAPSGTAGNAISFTQAMTLDASGNLALGTTAPNNGGNNGRWLTLSAVAGSTYSGGLSFAIGGTNQCWVYQDTDNLLAFQGAGSNAGFKWMYGGSERARIDSSGRFLVGTTVTNFGSMITAFSASSYTFESQRSTTGSEGHIAFVNANGAVGTIFTNGTSTAYNTSSDYRLKNITGPITNSGAYIDSLNPVEGTWKADGSTFVGLIAHEAQEASRTPVATGTKDGEQMQGMDYSSPEIIANLIAEVKSLRARLAAANI
jgi:hypothetical protein